MQSWRKKGFLVGKFSHLHHDDIDDINQISELIYRPWDFLVMWLDSRLGDDVFSLYIDNRSTDKAYTRYSVAWVWVFIWTMTLESKWYYALGWTCEDMDLRIGLGLNWPAPTTVDLGFTCSPHWAPSCVYTLMSSLVEHARRSFTFSRHPYRPLGSLLV